MDVSGVTPHGGGAGASPGLTVYALRMAPDLRQQVVHDLAEAHVLARDHFPLLCGPGTAWPDSPIATVAPRPVAPEVGPQVMCLPFHGRVTVQDATRIAQVIRHSVKRGGR